MKYIDLVVLVVVVQIALLEKVLYPTQNLIILFQNEKLSSYYIQSKERKQI